MAEVFSLVEPRPACSTKRLSKRRNVHGGAMQCHQKNPEANRFMISRNKKRKQKNNSGLMKRFGKSRPCSLHLRWLSAQRGASRNRSKRPGQHLLKNPGWQRRSKKRETQSKRSSRNGVVNVILMAQRAGGGLGAVGGMMLGEETGGGPLTTALKCTGRQRKMRAIKAMDFRDGITLMVAPAVIPQVYRCIVAVVQCAGQ